MKKALYCAVRDKLKADLTWLKFIDLDKKQVDKPTENLPFPIPAVLIKLSSVDWENLSNGYQSGEVLITIGLYLDNSGESFDGAESETNTLIDLLDKPDEVFNSLQGFDAVNIQHLVRIEETELRYTKRYAHTDIVFKTRIVEAKTDTKINKTLTDATFTKV